ncbi:MAG: glycosyltransferase [Thermodesulfobacteriota bacterium]
MLSAHRIQLDRRIVSEANALVASGRELTLVSVPTDMGGAVLDSRIRVVMPDRTDRSSGSGSIELLLSRLSRYLPGPFFLRMTPREQFDVIHCHDLKTLPSAVAVKRKWSPDAKLVYDSHELYPYQWENRGLQTYWSWLERRYIKEANLIITVNESIAGKLEELYRVKRPEVLYNSYGVFGENTPVTEKAFLEHFGAPEGGFKVIFQGNLGLDRNLDNLTAAFGLLDESMKLFLLGTGPAEAALRRLIASNDLRNVFIGPWVPQERLMAYLARADLGVIPYVGDSLLNNLYCTPNKLFEYIEAGVPICASDLPELRRVIRGQGIGEVYRMAGPEAIAAAIENCASRCLRGEFSEERFRAARDAYGWPRQEEKLLRLYDQLAG